VAHVLEVAAGEFGHPVVVFVEAEADGGAIHRAQNL